jgi:hypothetical protein
VAHAVDPRSPPREDELDRGPPDRQVAPGLCVQDGGVAEPFVEPPVSRGGRWLLLFPLLFLGLLIVTVPMTVEAVRAATDRGAPGTFVVEEVQCGRMCEAVGMFQPADGGPAVQVGWGGQAYQMAAGQEVDAVLVDGGTTAFPPGGSWAWLVLVALSAALLAGFIASVRSYRRARAGVGPTGP